MTARRTLSPAARGVVLAVRAALRAGRVDLADQADGSTLATSTAPDGTVLLRAVLRLPVPGADPRQLTLPAVTAVPAPAEAPPAPVAVPAGEDTETTRINGLAVGDQITLDDELVEVMGLDDDGWTWRTVDTDPRTRDEGECLWAEVERVAPTRWRVRPVDTETPAQQREAAKAAKPKRARKALKAAPAAGPVIDDDEALWEIVLEDWPARCRGLDMLDDETAVLWTNTGKKGADHIRTVVPGKHVPTIRTRALDAGATILREEPSDAPCHLVRVGGEVETTQGLMGFLGTVDDNVNAMIGLVLEGARTVDGGKPFVAWADEARVVDGRVVVGISKWWTAVRDGETWHPERLPEERREALAPAKREKAKPARLTPVPEADALARYGERSIVAQLHEGDAWGLVWSDKLPGQMTYAVAVESVLEQAHRARVYNRGQHCTRDSRDGAT